MLQVLWELLTHQVPFSGLDGFHVAWIVVEHGTVSNCLFVTIFYVCDHLQLLFKTCITLYSQCHCFCVI